MSVILGNLRSIGPIELDFRHPTGLRWVGSPTSKGIQPCSITGSGQTNEVHRIRELVNNPAAQITYGGFTGVMDYLVMNGDALGPFEGNYIMSSCTLEVDRRLIFGGMLAFQLDAAFLGDVDGSAPPVPILTELEEELVTE